MRVLVLLPLVLCFAFATPLYAKKKLPTLEELEAQTKHHLFSTKRHIKVAKVDTTISLYYAYAYITINVPFEKAAKYILDIENYENVFDALLDVHKAPDARWPNKDIYYLEGKTSVVHGWAVGVLDEMYYKEDAFLRVKIRPAPRKLVYEYKNKLRGKIKYYIKKVHLDGTLIKVDQNSCRIGLRGISSTNKPMPLWIVNILMKIALPNLLDDIEKRVKEDEKALEKLDKK